MDSTGGARPARRAEVAAGRRRRLHRPRARHGLRRARQQGDGRRDDRRPAARRRSRSRRRSSRKRIETHVREAVMLNTKVVGDEGREGRHRVTFEGEGADRSEQTFDRVLVSVGRRPNSKIPASTRPGSRSTARASSRPTSQRRTAEPTIYAIGDVAGEPMLAHKASHEARVAVEAIAGHKARVRAAGDSGGRLHRSRRSPGRPDRGRGGEAEAARSRSRSSRGARSAARSRSTAPTA